VNARSLLKDNATFSGIIPEQGAGEKELGTESVFDFNGPLFL
jgi:hypothetical protein